MHIQLKAVNVHIATNKNKMLLILYSSKTHSKANYPQQVKIAALMTEGKNVSLTNMLSCPFEILRQYLKVQGGYTDTKENFFVFKDYSPVKATHMRNTLHNCLHNLNLNDTLYNCHSLRIGRSCDLFKLGHSIDEIKKIGRWKSNAIYKYLRD